jgi:Leucine-rich repeat (LRR) protein
MAQHSTVLSIRPAFFCEANYETRASCSFICFRYRRATVTEVDNNKNNITMEVAKDISNGTAPDVYAMDDGFTDVDTDMAASDFAASGKDVGASLPSAEEVRHTVHMKRGSKSAMSCKTIMTIAVVACVIIAASLGLGVGVSNNKSGSSEQSSLGESFDKGERKSDIKDVINYLIAEGVSTEFSLKTLDTPQNIAVRWLSNDDEANTAVPDVPITVAEGYRYITRYVLAVVYFSTGGAQWNFQAGFGTIADVCSWNQIKFDGSNFYRQGALCDAKTGLIFALDLGTWIRNEEIENDDMRSRSGIRFCNLSHHIMLTQYTFHLIFADSNNLVGTIPPEIGALNTLELFSMDANSLVGELPTQICKLFQLETLELSFNGLGGRIPACIAEMQSLELIFLSDNLLTGPLPATIGTLSKLRGLIIDDNALSGEVANLFNNLPDLRWLHLEDNDFYGTINDSFLAFNTLVLQLDLSGNNFEGTLPPHLLSMPNLQILDVHSNRLDGKIPQVLAVNKKLIFLSMHDNSITGQLPNTLAKLQRLLHLDGK